MRTPLDEHLRQLERRLGVEISTRGNAFQVQGEPAPVEAAGRLIRRLYASTGEESLTAERVHLFLQESAIEECTGEDAGEDESVKVRRGIVRGGAGAIRTATCGLSARTTSTSASGLRVPARPISRWRAPWRRWKRIG